MVFVPQSQGFVCSWICAFGIQLVLGRHPRVVTALKVANTVLNEHHPSDISISLIQPWVWLPRDGAAV